MEKFQVYNRELKTWVDDNVSIISGWNENFVIDKTTDTAQIKLKYKGLEMPKWNIHDWCRIVHGDKATYTSKRLAGERTVQTEKTLNIKIEPKGNVFEVYFYLTSDVSFMYETITFQTSVRYKESYNADYQTAVWNITLNEDNDYETRFNFNINPEYAEIAEVTFSNVSPLYLRGYQYFYIPENHEQYLIKNITTVKDVLNEEIDIQLDLIEPIEKASGILCETMSFTNQISKKVGETVYTHEPLNHLSVLEKILKVTPANTDTYEIGYDKNKNKSWYNRIKILDVELLQKIPFNDETYSEASLYEILLNKYDSSVGRTPVFYFDIDKLTDLPRNLERDEYLLSFERQDGFDEEEVELSNLLEDASSVIHNQSGENFAQGLISNFDNLSPNSNIYTPAKTLWLVPEINTNERVLTSYNSGDTEYGKWVLRTPHKIKKINSVERFYIQSNATTYQTTLSYINRQHKIYTSDRILSLKEYNASEVFNQRDCVWYEEGSNIIHLNEVYYNSPNGTISWEAKTWVYKVEYEPLVTGRFDLANDYQVQINQLDSQIDNKKFGDYLKEYLASMNKTDFIISKTVEKFSDIKPLASRVVENDKVYLITKIGIQNRGNDLYDVVYQLNENHIRKSDTIQAPQQIRKNIEIGVDATKERKSMLCFNAGISYKKAEEDFYKTALNGYLLQKMFSQLNKKQEESELIQLANFTFKSKLQKEDGSKEDFILNMLCEIATFYMSNTICFNMKYIDNAEAGKSKTLSNSTINIINSVFYSTPEYQIPVLYTNPFGEFETFDVDFIKVADKDIIEIEPDVDISSTTAPTPQAQLNAIRKYLSEVYNSIKAMAKYPLTDAVSTESLENPIASFKNIQYFKDMLDAFNYTIGLTYKTTPDIILCDGFFKYNSLLRGKEPEEIVCEIFDKYKREDDVTTYSHNALITSISETEEVIGNTTVKKVTYTLNKSLAGIKSVVLKNWVSATVEGRVLIPLLIINNLNETGNSFSIYHS